MMHRSCNADGVVKAMVFAIGSSIIHDKGRYGRKARGVDDGT